MRKSKKEINKENLEKDLAMMSKKQKNIDRVKRIEKEIEIRIEKEREREFFLKRLELEQARDRKMREMRLRNGK